MNSNFGINALTERKAPWLLGIIGCLILSSLPFILSSYGLSLIIQILIFGLLAMSLNILIGYAGLVPFNHATYFGVSAYTVGILLTKGFSNFWISLIVGISIATFLAMLLGLLVLRSSGPYFLMVTLALGQMIFALAWKWRSLTGGDDGLP
ncbi:MAG: branched-chain amino acid transport system permease protein [Clostridia bacterium]|jgi:branched-chain amino acid transport system permease protein|nr:branched-chain amino acid transport system permease protein [Clostridia bacterium]MDN5322666.1 branched-chain amino acid transport system permease protein [Clostridia bacterium]